MKASVIVAIYKDIEALDLIIGALKTQTYKNFEVVIAEDNNSEEIKAYVDQIEGLDIKHVSQEDMGIRKIRILNSGILASSGEYLIFLDGDCVPYSTFVEAHIKLAEKGHVVCGRRVNLGSKYSKKLRAHQLAPLQLEKLFFWKFIFITKDANDNHTEEGFYFNPNGILYNLFLKNRRKKMSLLGCNYACFKKDICKINGYDEGYGETAVGDDTDLQWRFEAIGLKLKSAKYVANIFHLHHDRDLRYGISANAALKRMEINRKKSRYKCKIGLTSHEAFDSQASTREPALRNSHP